MEKKKLSSCYCKNIRKLSNNITKYYDKHLSPIGLTLNQYSLISNIEKIEPASVTQISKKADLERTTIVRNLQTLFKKGLIEDISDKGKRDKKIILTAHGKELLKEAKPYWDDAQENIYDKLGEDNFNNLVDILNILNSI